jgi:hypothetical protein
VSFWAQQRNPRISLLILLVLPLHHHTCAPFGAVPPRETDRAIAFEGYRNYFLQLPLQLRCCCPLFCLSSRSEAEGPAAAFAFVFAVAFRLNRSNNKATTDDAEKHGLKESSFVLSVGVRAIPWLLLTYLFLNLWNRCASVLSLCPLQPHGTLKEELQMRIAYPKTFGAPCIINTGERKNPPHQDCDLTHKNSTKPFILNNLHLSRLFSRFCNLSALFRRLCSI